MQFQIERYEDKELLELLEIHKRNCGKCSQASSLRNACDQYKQLHENVVKDAQAQKKRDVLPGLLPKGLISRSWYEIIDLKDLPTERLAVEFLKEAEQTRSAVALAATLEGIDVSIWQGRFPWNEAVNAGISLGIAKSSEGNGYTDPQWGWNLSQLLIPGPIVGGSYHFARPDLGNSPQAEGGWYISRHSAACFDPNIPWIFSLDAESNGGSAQWCYGFLDTISNKIGYSCWFYSYVSWITSRGVQAFTRPLWLAWPNPSTPPTLGWEVLTMQQYGTRAFSVGQVDANEFFGDKTTLYKLGGVTNNPPSPDIPIPPPVPILKSRGQKVLAFRNDDRWDYVFIRNGKLVRRWGNSISGMKDGLQLDNVTPWGEADESNPGVKLVPGTEWVTWTPSGNYQTMGAQGVDGQQYYIWGDLGQGNLSGWQKIKDTIADLPLVGPAGPTGAPGPAGPPTYMPHKHTTTITEVAETDGGKPIKED
jgi:GH25 family lysozyme M1 (1,4-beta-N-acetylmuramidase)